MNPYEEWILLDRIPHLGAKKCRELVEHLGSPQKVFAASLKELSSIPGLNKDTITHLNRKTSERDIREDLKSLDKLNGGGDSSLSPFPLFG